MVEEAIKCVKVIDGVDTCTVAFVPGNCLSPPKAINDMNNLHRLWSSMTIPRMLTKEPKPELTAGLCP